MTAIRFQAMRRPPTQLKYGIPFILIAALASATLVLFVKLAAETLPIAMVAFSRYLITLLIISATLLVKQQKHNAPPLFNTERLKMHLLRGTFGTLGVFSFFFTAKHLPLAYATVLFNTTPLFIPIIVYFWHRVKIIHRLWIGLAIGYMGVILMLHPSHAAFHFAIVIGLLSGLCRSMVLICSRSLSYTEPVLRTMLYYAIYGTVASLLFVVPQLSTIAASLNWTNVTYLLLAGSMAYIYQFCMTSSTRYAPVRLTSSFLYIAVIISLFYDWFVWKVVPSTWAWFGIGLIILGACSLLFLYPRNDYQLVEKKKKKA